MLTKCFPPLTFLSSASAASGGPSVQAWGTDFIHAGKPASVTAPAYIDPYELLRQEEELLPMVPFRPQPDRPL